MYYPAKFKREVTGYSVSFRDIPEALTQGDSYEEALAMAKDALLTAMGFYYESYRPIPLPSKPKNDEVKVEVNANAIVKILLYNEMIKQHIKKSQLARLLNIRPQQVTRLFDFKQSSSLDTMDAAFKVIGKTLQFEVRKTD